MNFKLLPTPFLLTEGHLAFPLCSCSGCSRITNYNFCCRHMVSRDLLWSPYGIGQNIIFSCCGFYLSIYLFFLI